MLKISEFSKLTFLPVKTLRYYDEIGLLPAAQVDPFTGYRYYSYKQLPRLHKLLALRELGFSLEQIRQMLDENLSVEQMRGMLRLRQAETQERLEQEQMRLLFIENKLRQLEQEGQMSAYEVVLKSVPAFEVATLQGSAPDWPHIGPTLNRMFDTVMSVVHQSGAKLTEDMSRCGITLYVDTEYRTENIELETAMAFEGKVQPAQGVVVKMLPAVETMASVIHEGPFSTLSQAYDAVTRWIEENGYEVCGPNREINLVYERGGDESKFVTEIQFPVRKRA